MYSLITITSQIKCNDSQKDSNQKVFLNLLKELEENYPDFKKSLKEQLNKIKDTNKDMHNFLSKEFFHYEPEACWEWHYDFM